MPRKFIAILLTAFVLPGLGQLYLGQRIKGGILLALTNCFLIAAIFIILPGVGKLLVAAQAGQAIGASIIALWLSEHAGVGKGLLASFLIIWGYSVLDILTCKYKLPSD